MITKYFKFLSLVLFITVLLSSCAALLDTSERKDGPYEISGSRMPSEPGKCYANCLISDKYEMINEDILVFTGDNPDVEGVELQTFILNPNMTKWMKVKSDTDCHSINPDDCLVWPLEVIPEVAKEYFIVVDTSVVKEFVLETLSITELIQEGGFSEWREVVCQADVTEQLYTDVQLALIDFGFGENIIPNGVISKTTKDALVKFQESKGLSIGSLTKETLDYLEVDY